MYRTLIEELKNWKDDPDRYPVLLRGARQVGKTYLIEKFGREEFEDFVLINFEAQPEAMACFTSLDPEQILIKLQALLGVQITPRRTLLFLDEIQACPKAILAMRYFKENMPQLHLIGAGSLLDFAISDKSFSFPVGRIQFMYLKPLSFVEYAKARGVELFLNDDISSQRHAEYMALFKEYCVVGGMPAAVSHFSKALSLQRVSTIHEVLLSTYEADFSKYSTPATEKYLKVLYKNIFPQVAKHFKYSKVDPDIRSRELKYAINHLEWAGLLYPVHSSSASGLPLSAQIKSKKFKVLFLDVGLVQHALGIDPQLLLEKDLMQINRGSIAEQVVGQELLAYANPCKNNQLFYWEREKQPSSAEVDYLFSHKEHIIPIEVKAGVQGRLQSLHQFMKEKKSQIGVHIGSHPISNKAGILCLPPYAISKLGYYLDQVFGT